MKTLTQDEFEEMVDDEFDRSEIVWTKINTWLERGDGVAIYRNEDLSHRDVGLMQFVSYGSPAAQLEDEEPPKQLPDIGGSINWRYQLWATFKR